MTDEDDTMPAPHPETPDWALQHYDTLTKVYQAVVKRGREEAGLAIRLRHYETEHRDFRERLMKLEEAVFGATQYPVSDEDTDPGPRN